MPRVPPIKEESPNGFKLRCVDHHDIDVGIIGEDSPIRVWANAISDLAASDNLNALLWNAQLSGEMGQQQLMVCLIVLKHPRHATKNALFYDLLQGLAMDLLEQLLL
jgi:hypothetical protein